MNTVISNTIPRRSPFFAATDLSGLFEAIAGSGTHAVAAPSMPIDVVEYEDRVVVAANVPGFTKEQVSVEFHEGVLTIAAVRPDAGPADAGGAGCCGGSCGTQKSVSRVVHRERPVASVRRAIAMPDRVTGDGITADLADGVLTVTLPYARRPEPRRISVH